MHTNDCFFDTSREPVDGIDTLPVKSYTRSMVKFIVRPQWFAPFIEERIMPQRAMRPLAQFLHGLRAFLRVKAIAQKLTRI